VGPQPNLTSYASSSSCAIIYYLARNITAQTKLRKELDDELVGNTEPVTSFDQVKHLPYLNACINEALRLHSTSSMGLPRLAPGGGLEVCGRWYPEGTVLSVPSYTIHRDAEVWGADFEEYRYGG
jgi:benzoate 4-monooxygenase